MEAGGEAETRKALRRGGCYGGPRDEWAMFSSFFCLPLVDVSSDAHPTLKPQMVHVLLFGRMNQFGRAVSDWKQCS